MISSVYQIKGKAPLSAEGRQALIERYLGRVGMAISPQRVVAQVKSSAKWRYVAELAEYKKDTRVWREHPEQMLTACAIKGLWDVVLDDIVQKIYDTAKQHQEDLATIRLLESR